MKHEFRSQNAGNRKGFYKNVTRKYGKPAWNQCVIIDNAIAVPFVHIYGDVVSFGGIMHAFMNNGKFKFKLLSRKDILKGGKNKGSILDLYNLGLLQIFEKNINNEIDCEVAELLGDQIKDHFGDDVNGRSHARDVVITCYQVVEYYQDCISFGSTTMCGPVYSEPVYSYCTSEDISISGGGTGSTSNDGEAPTKPPLDFEPCFDSDCFVEPCWREVLGENKAASKSLSEFCDRFKGLTFDDLERDVPWLQNLTLQNQLIDDGYRYIRDPQNNDYVLDMRHVIFVGFYLGVEIGSIIEEGQAILDNPSGNNWQDFYSNAIGNELESYIRKRLRSFYIKDNQPVSYLCDFLRDRNYSKLRPKGGDC